MIGKRQIYPVLRGVPIWKFGPVYDWLDGRYVGQGWTQDRYMTREVGS